MPDIVDIAISTEGFSTLVAAVKAADLVEVLKGEGPFTVFAPTDEAFSKLPPGTVQTLVQNPPQLARILKYHVVLGRFTESELKDRDRLTSVEGSAIPLDLSDQFEVKNATVVSPNIDADNGVIHVIDTVMIMG